MSESLHREHPNSEHPNPCRGTALTNQITKPKQAFNPAAAGSAHEFHYRKELRVPKAHGSLRALGATRTRVRRVAVAAAGLGAGGALPVLPNERNRRNRTEPSEPSGTAGPAGTQPPQHRPGSAPHNSRARGINQLINELALCERPALRLQRSQLLPLPGRGAPPCAWAG